MAKQTYKRIGSIKTDSGFKCVWEGSEGSLALDGPGGVAHGYPVTGSAQEYRDRMGPEVKGCRVVRGLCVHPASGSVRSPRLRSSGGRHGRT